MKIFVTIFAISMTCAFVHGFVSVRPNLHSGMENGENCGMRSKQGSASQLNEINCMLNPESCVHQAAWYEDRDNSMEPVSSEEGVGAAMVTVATSHGVSQGVQVCPGVYLTTAHGIEEAEENLSEDSSWIKLIHYPMNPDNMTEVSTQNAQITFSSHRESGGDSSDYAFIRVDNPQRPNDIVTPVQASDQRLVQVTNNGSVDVHLYRPQTRYGINSDGAPDFSEESWVSGLADIMPLYQNPLRVRQTCRVGIYSRTGLMGHDCPSERAVSGSPYVTSLQGRNYLIGIQRASQQARIENYNPDFEPNVAIQSSHFCEDFEAVCGQPCAQIEDLTPASSETVSL